MKAIPLAPMEAEEALHKMWVLHDTPDLLADYGLEQDSVLQDLIQTIPFKGGVWQFDERYLPAVKGELENACVVLRDIAGSILQSDPGQALQCFGLAKRLESKIENL